MIRNTDATVITTAFLLAATLPGCNRTNTAASGGAPPPVPVSVATAAKGDAPILIRTIGTVDSKARVMLRPRCPAASPSSVHPKAPTSRQTRSS